ncbi:hypothetical protein [Exiguobacterium antarcticum]|uniref:hypothetical protein n=1 Tax=Exiguobacterium antarcticum TaxID=132920 RepID=UPI00047AED34|nr:hypothetical protein [Exiguobacterium antarcticum]
MKLNKYPFAVLSSLVILSPFSNGLSVFAEDSVNVMSASEESVDETTDEIDFSEVDLSEVYTVNNSTADNSVTIETPDFPFDKPFELNDSGNDYSAQGFGYSRTWSEKSEDKYWGKRKRASKLLANCGTRDANQGIGFSRTETWSANFNLGLPDIKKVKTTIGFTLTKSSTISSTVGINVAPGSIGWIDFRPLKYKTTGTFYNRMDGMVMSSQYLKLLSPKMLRGELDGVHVSQDRKMSSAERNKFCSKKY